MKLKYWSTLTYLLTTGGEDRAIMQWKLDVDDVNHEEEEVSGSEMDIMNEGKLLEGIVGGTFLIVLFTLYFETCCFWCLFYC